MRTYLDCFPCILRQTLEVARAATTDERQHRELLNRVMALLQELHLEVSPPEIGQVVHRLIRETTGNPDPYADQKRRQNETALRFLPVLRERVRAQADPVAAAARFAIAGNVIDLGANSGDIDLEAELELALQNQPAIDDYGRFLRDIRRARLVLYLGDNAGEIVFDRLFIETLRDVTDAEIVFVVRGHPVLNDATLADAAVVGMAEVARVVQNGSDAPATVLAEVNAEVRELFERADVILAKGQGNYESLNTIDHNIYFLFKVKCNVVARETGLQVGQYVFGHVESLRDGRSTLET